MIGFTAQRPEDEPRTYGHSSGALDDGEGAGATGGEGEEDDDVRLGSVGERSGAAAEAMEEVELLASGSGSPWTLGSAEDAPEPEEEEEEEEDTAMLESS